MTICGIWLIIATLRKDQHGSIWKPTGIFLPIDDYLDISCHPVRVCIQVYRDMRRPLLCLYKHENILHYQPNTHSHLKHHFKYSYLTIVIIILGSILSGVHIFICTSDSHSFKGVNQIAKNSVKSDTIQILEHRKWIENYWLKGIPFANDSLSTYIELLFW